MRTTIISLISVAVAVAACNDQQQPTSPARPTGAVSPTYQVDKGSDIRTPSAGSLTATRVTSAWVDVQPGVVATAKAICPSNSVLSGGGFDTDGASVLDLGQSKPADNNLFTWQVSATNNQRASISASIRAYAICLSQ